MPVQVSYKKQFLFGIMLLVVVLVVVEGFVNVWWYQVNVCAFENNEIFEDLDNEAKRQLCLENFELQYTSEGIEPNQKGESININNEGFRGPEITKAKPENTYRIFVVGGSTTFGVGVKDDETAPAHLQKIFDYAKIDFKVEVINAGIPGAWSRGEVKFVKERLIEYEPDLFIIYDGVNDVGEVRKSGATQWKERWLEICNMGKDHGFDTIITIQPLLGTGTRIPTDKEFPFFQEYEKTDFMEPYSLFVEQFEELNTSCTLTADFRGIFDAVQETIFFDVSHVNSKGNEIIAENWYKISLPLILDKASEITSGRGEALKTIVEINSNSSTINSNSVLDESFNTLRKLFLSYKTPRVLLHLPTVLENNILQQNIGFDHTKGGVDYIMSDKASCEALGGVWNNVQYCSVSNFIIKTDDTVLIKNNIVLKILDKLVNYGTIIIDAGSISNVNSELINQDGIIIINRSGSLRGVDGNLSNNGGNITINGGVLFNHGGIVNNNLDSIITSNFGGYIINLKGGVINNNGGTIINDVRAEIHNTANSKIINNEGIIIINNTSKITNNLKSEINNNGGSIINNGGWINNKADSVFNNNNNGYIENINGGKITNCAGCTFNNLEDAGAFVNKGDFLNECGGIVIIDGTIGPNQIVNIQCT